MCFELTLKYKLTTLTISSESSTTGAERVMKLKVDLPGEIPALIDEMVDRLDDE